MRSKSEGWWGKGQSEKRTGDQLSRRCGAFQRWGSIELMTTFSAIVWYLRGVIKDGPP